MYIYIGIYEIKKKKSNYPIINKYFNIYFESNFKKVQFKYYILLWCNHHIIHYSLNMTLNIFYRTTIFSSFFEK